MFIEIISKDGELSDTKEEADKWLENALGSAKVPGSSKFDTD